MTVKNGYRLWISLWLIGLLELTYRHKQHAVIAFSHSHMNNRYTKNASLLRSKATLSEEAAETSSPCRRSFLFGTVGIAFSASQQSTIANAEELKILSAPGRCASGVGDGCEEVADDNPFIRDLQAKSALKKDQYYQEALDAYNRKNYPDFFASYGKIIIKKKSDNSYVVVTETELEELKRENKVKTEYAAKVMGGKVMDYTQKPMLVLVED